MRRKPRRRRPLLRRPLSRWELLEGRRMLATDLGQIAGTVVNDLDNGPMADVAAVGQQLELFLDDGTTPGVFDAGDTSQGMTTTDASGAYSFDSLVAGTYFVRINPSTGTQTRPGENVSAPITFTPAQAMGTTNITIDDFSTAQTTTASTAATNPNSSADGPNAGAGGVRDLFAQINSGAGTVDLTSDFVGTGILNLSTTGNVLGTASVVWDGADGDATVVDTAGLALDLLNGGANSALAINAAADRLGSSVTVRLFSGPTSISEAALTITDTDAAIDGDTAEALSIPFTDFTTAGASAADLSAITAIEVEFDFSAAGQESLDAQVDVVGVVGFTTQTADFTVLNELSIGDRVFLDLDNDGLLETGENGIAGVALTLFTDNNGDDSVAGETQVATTTTDGTGNYLFTGLLPGDYLVRVDASNFTTGNALAGLATSTGNDVGGVAPDPDTPEQNNTDKGTVQGDGSVLSAGVTLVGDAEPAGGLDGDNDANTNLTLDFGFFGYDLVISKDVDQATAGPNDPLVYTIVVTNNGPTNATGVTLTDTLPTGVTFASANSSQGSITGSAGNPLVAANIGALVPGAMATITINATTDSDAAGTLINSSTVSGVDESDTTNNTATAQTVIVPEVDLTITKVDDDGGATLAPGDTVTYTITPINNGPSDATSVVVTDVLPTGLTFNPTGSTVPASQTAVAGGTQLTYNVGALGAGVTGSAITLVATIDAGFAGVLTNNASIAATEAETNPANNTASASSTVVIPTVDLSITKVDDDNNQPVTPGQTITYTIVATNNGPSDATGVVVTDVLPTGLTFVSASQTPTTDTPVTGGRELTFALGALAGGVSAPAITINATVDGGLTGVLTNTASVAGTEMEINPANNTATAQSTPQLGAINGRVFVDVDGDNTLDAEDRPIQGVILTLFNSANQPVATTTTDANGQYQFTGLLPDTYRVVQTQPTLFPDLDETSGTPGSTVGAVENEISNLVVNGDVAEANDFTEGVPTLGKRSFFFSSGLFN